MNIVMFCAFPRYTGNVCRNSDWIGSVKLLRIEAEEAMLQTWVEQPFCWSSENCVAHIQSLNDVTKINEFAPIRHFFLFFSDVAVSSVLTKLFSMLSQNGSRTSGRISCQEFWEVSVRCIQWSSYVSLNCPIIMVVELLEIPIYLFVQFMESEICSGCLLNSTGRMDALFEVCRGEQHPLAPLQHLLPWNSATGWFRPYRYRLFWFYLYPQNTYN